MTDAGMQVKSSPSGPDAAPILESARGASIDDLMKKGLYALDLIIKDILTQVSGHTYDRETVQNLKDAMTMLHELKKKEQELIDNLSDEQLEAMVNASKPTGGAKGP